MNMQDRFIIQSLEKLVRHIEQENYKGFDPYDGLTSPLFRLPVLKSNKSVRFLAQQLVKRSPVNLRPLLGIKKRLNPVTLGLCIQGYTQLIRVFPERKQEWTAKIDWLISQLEKLIPEGFHGPCWGYDFDWEARYASIPAFQPTIVATGIITNALFNFYLISGNNQSLTLCSEATNFILQDLKRTTGPDGSVCFSYSPFDKQVVFNASMKAVRPLSQVYSVNGKKELKDIAHLAVSFVMNHQRPDGAWIYSTSKAGTWIDNYHTGYILDGLKSYISLCKDDTFKEHFRKGFDFYEKNFFHADGMPKFYNSNPYPTDCTAAAQSILTLTSNQKTELAVKVARFTITQMQSPDGYFYFRKFKHTIRKTSFMRWSDAWMFAALATLAAYE